MVCLKKKKNTDGWILIDVPFLFFFLSEEAGVCILDPSNNESDNFYDKNLPKNSYLSHHNLVTQISEFY